MAWLFPFLIHLFVRKVCYHGNVLLHKRAEIITYFQGAADRHRSALMQSQSSVQNQYL